jgi:hypothetical protein
VTPSWSLIKKLTDGNRGKWDSLNRDLFNSRYNRVAGPGLETVVYDVDGAADAAEHHHEPSRQCYKPFFIGK